MAPLARWRARGSPTPRWRRPAAGACAGSSSATSEPDGGVLKQSILNFEGADVRSVMDDDLLFTAEEPEVAVLVGVGQITGVQPFVGHDLVGCRRGVPVTHHAAV